jgi:hypothetical protein
MLLDCSKTVPKPNLIVYQFSGNGKPTSAQEAWSGLSSMPGLAATNSALDRRISWQFGGGILKELNAHWGPQASYNFHAVNTPGAATKFSTLQEGIRYVV